MEPSRPPPGFPAVVSSGRWTLVELSQGSPRVATVSSPLAGGPGLPPGLQPSPAHWQVDPGLLPGLQQSPAHWQVDLDFHQDCNHLRPTESAVFSPAPPAFPPKSTGLPLTTVPDPSLKTDALAAEEECGVEDILSPLNEALDKCRKSVRKQVCDDVSKRLVTLEQMWTQGKLSASVRRGMRILTEELKCQHWDAADEIHRSLMVDHINEVNQWMVGVKRLIAETRKLPTVDLALEEQEVATQLEPEHQ